MKISIPKWATFQHYKDRRPDWVKLYRSLLENRHWHSLSGDAAKLLVELWLIASESDDGTIDVGTEEVAWRLRKEPERVAAWLLELEQAGFVDLSVQDAGTTVKPTDFSVSPPPDDGVPKSLYGNVRGSKSPVPRGEESREEDIQQRRTSTSTDGAKRKKSSLAPLPDDWTPIGSHTTKAEVHGLNLADEAEAFRNHHVARGNRMADWNAAFHTWLSNSVKWSRPKPPSLRVVNGREGSSPESPKRYGSHTHPVVE